MVWRIFNARSAPRIFISTAAHANRRIRSLVKSMRRRRLVHTALCGSRKLATARSPCVSVARIIHMSYRVRTVSEPWRTGDGAQRVRWNRTQADRGRERTRQTNNYITNNTHADACELWQRLIVYYVLAARLCFLDSPVATSKNADTLLHMESHGLMSVATEPG